MEEKLRELGVEEKREEKPLKKFEKVPTGSSRVNTVFAEADKNQRSYDNTIWVDAGEPGPRGSRWMLQNCLVVSWREPTDPLPTPKEMEAWAKVVWRLNGEILVSFLNQDLMLFEFDITEEANRVLEKGCRIFRGRVMDLESWSPYSGCVRRKNLMSEAWVRVVELSSHLWTHNTLRLIGDSCGGFLALDTGTTLRSVVLWARILVKLMGNERPSTINILAGLRSYKLQLWWDLPTWLVEVYP